MQIKIKETYIVDSIHATIQVDLYHTSLYSASQIFHFIQ